MKVQMSRLLLRQQLPALLLAGTLLAAMLPNARLSARSEPAPPADLSATAIIERLSEHNHRRNQLLASYQVARRYHLKNELYGKEVVMEVEVGYRAPDKMSFEIRRWVGSSFLAGRVFGRMMEGERKSLQAKNRRRSAMTAENYEFRLAGRETVLGRPAYRLNVVPRRKDTFLFTGRIWVDAEDFALVRAEGQPAKRPSFWTRKIDFVRTYKKVGPFWLPQRTEVIVEVFLFGTSWVNIENNDYRVRLNPAAAVTAKQRQKFFLRPSEGCARIG